MTLVERLRELDETGYGPLTGAIGAEAASELERLGDIVQKQGDLILMQEQELLSLRGPLAPLLKTEAVAADRIEQLEAENAALREDAERYRVLRSSSEWIVATRLDDVEYSDEWLDDAIDAERGKP